MTNDLVPAFEIPEESSTDDAPADAMTRLAQLTQALLAAKNEIYRLDQLMIQQEQVAAALEGEDIPELMKECEFTEIKLADGSIVTLKHEFTFGISDERRIEAHMWLRKNLLGGIIKVSVTVPFGRDEEAAALTLQAKLQAAGLPAEAGESIHYQTLKATLKELREKGKALPDALFGIHPYDIAAIKPPKGVTGPGKVRKRA